MKVVHIVPGSGGTFYCENCIRDSSLVKALRALGHDVMMVPMYLPMFTDEPDLQEAPVFFGGINVYLQQTCGLFRRTPRWLDRLFDSKLLLGMAARQAGSTRPTGLEGMTLSMIRGEEGRQAKELDRLMAWLSEYEKPDIVHLSNALLIGLARRIREELRVPVVCSLQDEDTWVDAMEEPFRTRCWKAIEERSADVALFVAVSRHYAGLIRGRFPIPDEKLAVVHIGTNGDGHDRAPLSVAPPTVGYLSRLAEQQGFDVLVDAVLKLRSDGRIPDLRLKATGGATGDNRRFLAGIRRRVRRAGAQAAVEIVADFERASRLRFLQQLAVMCVPLPRGEAFGVFVIEAMASGVPLVEPRVGAFAELIESHGAGVLYEPNTPERLADVLADVLADRDALQRMGAAAREAFLKHFTIEAMARNMEAVYQGVLS